MHEDSIEKTAFSPQDHHWEFVRCPFGLKNMPSDFSRIMYLVLGDLPYVQIYLDDFSVHSESFEQHIHHIETVLDRLKEANRKINPDTCPFCAERVKILGHIASYNKIEVDPAKV
jgi:hypothetical protein